jgi:DNA damage-binding protein 1
LDSYQFKRFETVQALDSVNFRDDENVYFVVGTVFVYPNQEQLEKGRILVFKVVSGGTLLLVSENTVNGCVNCIASVEGRLLVGLEGRVELFAWELQLDSYKLTS